MANRQNKHSAFEDQWREAFEEAEMTPSANLWNNIDRELTVQESGRYRKGFIFYRWVAAASVVCLLGMGYFLWQNMATSDERMLSGRQANEPAETNLKNDQGAASAGKGANLSNNGLALQPQQERPEESPANNSMSGSEEAEQPPLLASGSESKNRKPASSAAQQALLPLAKVGQAPSSAVADVPASEMTSVLAIAQLPSLGPQALETGAIQLAEADEKLYRVPQVPADQKRAEEKINFYAGLNLGSNLFDPNFSQGGEFALASADLPELSNRLALSDASGMYSSRGQSPSTSGLDATPQLSFSYGVDVGMMLTRRLSLESGLDFGRMNTTTTTRWVEQDYELGRSTPILATNVEMAENVQYSPQQQELNSTFSFISLPIRLGYNFGFERLHFNISSGVAANFFLGNVLRDGSGRLSTVSLEADEAGAYQSVYYSAVLSGALQYRIDEKYSVSLSPNYNFSITDLTNNGNSFSSQPNIFALDLGVRYNFR